MSIEEASAPVVEEPVVEAAAANTATEKPEAGDGEEEKENNPKKAKAKKAAAPRKPRKLQSHPPYLEMIGAAITTLKDRTGSSQLAIAKYIEDKYKGHLPPNFRKVTLVLILYVLSNGELTRSCPILQSRDGRSDHLWISFIEI
ncbi:hypothetical protein HPP92_009469 [Vanilla planifolia]|uniref:H15 domain-containing protein n=1 Tax=Vanilla planifolia TaxID=51239 RepID=A0A835V4R0_VANPL|nr:hypothetical protein HPP92_009469 [Vanilla planifolia]